MTAHPERGRARGSFSMTLFWILFVAAPLIPGLFVVTSGNERHPSPDAVGLIMWLYITSVLGAVGVVTGHAERRRGIADGELGMYLNGILWVLAVGLLIWRKS